MRKFCGDPFKLLIEKLKNFDIIIDDGSHQSKHIISSFKFLFSYLNNNGIYVVEDLQTSYQPRNGGSRFYLNKKSLSATQCSPLLNEGQEMSSSSIKN